MRQIIFITYLCIGAGLILPLFGQNKQDYYWVMGYNGQNPHPDLGGTHWIFDEDSLRLTKVDQEANFYLTDASIADPETGELLLYSNGCAVYDNNGNIVANGDSISYSSVWSDFCPRRGYTHAQGACLLDFSDNEDTYYLIHANAEDNPTPGVLVGSDELLTTKIRFKTNQSTSIILNKNETIVDTLLHAGHLKSIRGKNANTWWVIMPGRYVHRYFTFLFNHEGVDTSFVQTINNGSLGTGGDGGGQAAFSPDGRLYARFDIVQNGLLLMDFDRSTGLLSNPRTYHIRDEDGDFTGGCSFSPNSRFIYVSTLDKIYQFDLHASDVQVSKTVVAEWDGYVDPFPTNFYLCNLGPDCRIYINSLNGVKSMHVIQYPDRKGLACQVAQHAIHLPTFNGITMPNFPHYRMDEEWPCDSTIGVQLTTSLELPEQRVEFQINPNPADDQIILSYQLDGIQDLRFELYDVSGMMVKYTQVTYREFSQKMDVSDLPSGLYTWRLFNEQGAFTSGKIVLR